MKTEKTKISRTAAIKKARASVSTLYHFGDGWVHSFQSSFCERAWTQSHPVAEYDHALADRAQSLINRACKLLGVDDPPQYDGGPWTDYVD